MLAECVIAFLNINFCKTIVFSVQRYAIVVYAVIVSLSVTVGVLET